MMKRRLGMKVTTAPMGGQDRGEVRRGGTRSDTAVPTGGELEERRRAPTKERLKGNS